MGKLLLDSANLDSIKRMMQYDCVAGVTTNPSLVAREEKGDYTQKLLEIANVMGSRPLRYKRHLSVEVTSLDPEEMFKQAIQLKLDLQRFQRNIDLYIKIPVTFENLAVISRLQSHGINVNATACMNSIQAKLAADSGARIVSFFYNRIRDGKDSPNVAINEFISIREKTTMEGTIVLTGNAIICGSIRSKYDVLDCFKENVEFVTASEKIIREMCEHPQTTIAIKQFQEDIDAWLE